ncbi:MAG: hypothetical protein ABEH40_00215 [Haloferacaceae archaeon]
MALDRATRARLPAAAVALLVAAGGLALAAGVALALLPFPRLLGVAVPPAYRLVLAVLALLGGGVHLLAARWVRRRRSLFRVAMATLIGMVFLQASAPLDVLALACLWLSRDEFGADGSRGVA